MLTGKTAEASLTTKNFTAEVPLTTKNFNTLYKTLYLAATKWKDIGIFLGLSPNELEIIKTDESDSHSRLQGMLMLWLKQIDPKPTKSKMVKVLKELNFTKESAELEKQVL